VKIAIRLNELAGSGVKFILKTPVVKKRPEGYQAPWLVK
jgi:hypothetical protein